MLLAACIPADYSLVEEKYSFISRLRQRILPAGQSSPHIQNSPHTVLRLKYYLKQREAKKGVGDEIPKQVWAAAQRFLLVIEKPEPNRSRRRRFRFRILRQMLLHYRIA